MIKTNLINLEKLDENKKSQVEEIINQRMQYFDELFKRYPKDVTFEFKFIQKSSGWKIEAMVEMMSTTLFFEESGKNLIKVLSELFSKIKKQVKKQKAIERKDYEYKRAKYRKKLLSQKMFEQLIENHTQGNRENFDSILSDVYNDLEKDLIDNLIAKGKTEQEAENISKELMNKIKQEIYETFNANKEQREEFLDSISDISHYYESNL